MIKIRLSYNKGYKWFNADNAYVKGFVLADDKVLRETELVDYFSSAKTDDDFKKKLQKANGLYSVIIKKENAVWAAVDNVRAFPLFYCQKDDYFAVTDSPDEFAADNIPLMIDENNATILSYSGFVTGNKTLLKNIFQIVAGEAIFFENNVIRREFHTQFLTNHLFSCSREELKDKLKNALFRTGEHLVKILDNRPAFISLSSGFDSRVLAYLLKKNEYKNVTCYTYGPADSPEIKNARLVAEKLGYDWYFIDYDEFNDKKMNYDPLYKEYSHFAANYSAQALEQDYFAMQKLLSMNILPDNAVFVAGHSGAIAGSSLIKNMSDPLFSYVDYVLETTFAQVFPYKKDRGILRKEIAFLDDTEIRKKYPPHLIYENWRFKEHTSKCIHNAAKIWDFFGYEYLLPLWDLELFNFFVKVPILHKCRKKLYKETLAELFEEYDIFFKHEELYPSEKLVRKVAFRSKLKKKIPILKMFVNIWKTDSTDAKSFTKSFIEELKKEKGYRKMLNINGILSAWYLLEVRRKLEFFV